MLHDFVLGNRFDSNGSPFFFSGATIISLECGAVAVLVVLVVALMMWAGVGQSGKDADGNFDGR